MNEIFSSAGFLILVFLGVYIIYKSYGRKINLIVSIWLFSAGLWALGQIFLLNVVDNESLLWSIGLAHLGVFSLSATTLHFALVFPSRNRIMDKKFMPYLIYLLPLFFYICFITNSYHHLFYNSLIFNPSSVINYDKFFGIVGSLSFLMVYGFVFLGLFLFGYSTLKNIGERQKGSFLLTLGILIGIISAVLGEFNILPGTILFPISGVLFSYAILKCKVIEVSAATAAEKIIDTMTDCLVLTDENNMVRRVNNSFKTLFCSDEKDVIGKNVNDFLKTNFHDRLNSGKVVRNDQEIIKNLKGDLINISVNASSMRNQDGEIAGFVYTFTDVTKQRQSEKKLKERTAQVEELLSQKDKFIHLLAHDLKTPLTPLNALLPIIRDRVEDEKSKELLEVTVSNVKTMMNLIDDALELACLEDVEKDDDFVKINLSSIVDILVDENQAFLKDNNFIVEKKFDGDLCFFGNEFQIKEVFNNLLSNAVKYAPEDISGNITINADLVDNFIKVSFSDNGSGLNLVEKDKVFEKFFKIGNPRSGMQSTGLGLSLCKSIIDRHGGKIWVESPGIGQGSTFYFTLKNVRGGS